MATLQEINDRLTRIENMLTALVGVSDTPAPLDAVAMERILFSSDPEAMLRDRNARIRRAKKEKRS